MRRLLSFLLLLCCVTAMGQDQSEKTALATQVAAIQSAFDADADSLEQMVDKALPLAIKLKNIDAEMKMQRLLGDRLFVRGKFDKAIKRLFEAARHAEKSPPTKETALLYFGIAQVNSFNKYSQLGEQYLRRGIAIAEAVKDDSALGNGYNRMGIFFEKYTKHMDSALYFYQQAYFYTDRAGDIVGKAYALENLAGIYAEKNDMKTALSYQKQSLVYKQQRGRKIDIAIAYINLAETFDRIGKPDSVIYYAKETLTLTREIKYRDLEAYADMMLSALYEKKGDFKKALEYHKAYSTVNDSIYTVTKTKELTEVNAKYETEKREQKIKALNQQTTIQRLQLKQRNIFLFVAIGLIIAGGVIVYLAYNRRKLKEHAMLQEEINKQQAITVREVLNAEERERKRIAADLHDGVGQMLSATLLNLNSFFAKLGPAADKEQTGRILALVTESYDELRSISHQMMPNALLKAGLASAVKELVSGIDSNKLAISLEMVGLNERLKEEVETVLYRVIQESINNVIKHANANKLNIQVIRDEDGVSVTIEDNGKGFDVKKKAEGIGLKNMYSRVQFQQGTVDIDSQPGKGTLVLIHIPAASI